MKNKVGRPLKDKNKKKVPITFYTELANVKRYRNRDHARKTAKEVFESYTTMPDLAPQQ